MFRFITKKRWITIGISLVLALATVLSGITVVDKLTPEAKSSQSSILQVGLGQKVLTIKTAEASGVADYTCLGVNDNVIFQTAINALPATGGRIEVLGGTYVFAAGTTVTRAIANITINGVGRGTYITGDGATALFTAGGNDWTFSNFRTDAGGISVGATTGWVWNNVTINATQYAYRTASNAGATVVIPTGRSATAVVAASDANATWKAQADIVCDGVSDQSDINTALLLYNVVLSPGTFYCSSNITLQTNTRLLGQGYSTNINLVGARILAQDVSHVELGNFRMTGGNLIMTSDVGGIEIHANSANISDFYVHDVTNEYLNSQAAFFLLTDTFSGIHNITRVLFERCQSLNTDGHGFQIHHTSNVSSVVVSDITFQDCYAYRCGYAATRYNDYVSGFDIAEISAPNVTVDTVTLINCVAQECRRNGFHTEIIGTKKNINYIRCTSRQNNQVGAGAGFVFGNGQVTYTDCTSDGDYGSFYLDTNNNTASRVALINPTSKNALGRGIEIIDSTAGQIDIIGGLIKDCGGYGVYAKSQNVRISGLRVINPTGESNIANLFGTSGSPFSNSQAELYVETTAQYAVQVGYSSNVTLQGSLNTSHVTGRTLYLVGCNNVKVNNMSLVGLDRAVYVTVANTANITVQGCEIRNGTYGIFCDNGTDVLIQNNRFSGCTTPIHISNASVIRPFVTCNDWYGSTNDPLYTSAVDSIIRDNVGKNGGWWMVPTEEKCASGSLTAGNANAIAFSWRDLSSTEIFISKVVIEITTSGGTAGSHIDVGLADNSTGANRGTEFFNDITANVTAVYDSWVAGDGGTQTKFVVGQEYTSGFDGYVVGQILDANAASLVGKWYIYYKGR